MQKETVPIAAYLPFVMYAIPLGVFWLTVIQVMLPAEYHINVVPYLAVSFSWGILIGLGITVLLYFLWKNKTAKTQMLLNISLGIGVFGLLALLFFFAILYIVLN